MALGITWSGCNQAWMLGDHFFAFTLILVKKEDAGGEWAYNAIH